MEFSAMTCFAKRITWTAQRGVTLIELMVAMVLGLLVAAGIVTVFASTSTSNKAQTQLARLQEEGRFAIARLTEDLSMANGQYCTNSGGVAQAGSGGLFLDHLRTPQVFAKNLMGAAAGPTSGALHDLTTIWGASSGGVTYPAAPTAAYSLPAFLFMRGYDCPSVATCAPFSPTTAGLPVMGPAFGNRVPGTSVITVRYVNPTRGWAIGTPGGSQIATSTSSGTISSITLAPVPGEPPTTDFLGADLAMLADCSNAEIFAVTKSGAILTPNPALNFTGSSPAAQQPEAAPKLFDVNRDFQTVTYYLKVVSVNNDGQAPFTGALMRRVNGNDPILTHGGSEDELVRGIERMDFKYGVQDASGNTSFLTASQIEASTNCPPSEISSITTAGCLWRAVSSVEVSVLMSGQVPLYTLGSNDLNYVYNIDAPTLQAPSAHATKPTDQGFVNQLLRREFTALIAVRNYNP
jgi:type IV pilus assembly protein PilW